MQTQAYPRPQAEMAILSLENQRLELERWAERVGHEVVATYDDNGISGAKGRDYRQQYDAMLKAAVRREFDIRVMGDRNEGRGEQELKAQWTFAVLRTPRKGPERESEVNFFQRDMDGGPA
jgi:hypothetical protein